MARSGATNLAWRDGRPRWVPGPAIRALGFKAQSLQYENGAWMTLADARAEAAHLNAKVERKRMEVDGLPVAPRLVEEREKRPKLMSGFVYFLWVDQYVKIGFSLDPFSRVEQLRTGIPGQIKRMAAIVGSTLDERRLHRRYADVRSRGEWFLNTSTLECELLSFVVNGRISLSTDMRQFDKKVRLQIVAA